MAGERTATVIRLDSVRGGQAASPPRPSRGGGDVVCLAA
jgi:hypothetical protein